MNWPLIAIVAGWVAVGCCILALVSAVIVAIETIRQQHQPRHAALCIYGGSPHPGVTCEGKPHDQETSHPG